VSERGYNNLISHLNSKLHRDEWRAYYMQLKEADNNQDVIAVETIKASAQAQWLYDTIKFIVQTHQPNSIVEHPSFRKLTKLNEFQS
jgi:hypothetical protein